MTESSGDVASRVTSWTCARCPADVCHPKVAVIRMARLGFSSEADDRSQRYVSHVSTAAQVPVADDWPARRRGVLRQALAVGVATGAYGVSFGAVSAAAGLSVLQTSALSLLMFSGASQFALVGVIGAGGSAFAAAATATLLGTRNAFYGLRLASLLRVRGVRRLVGAQVVIDESTAMAVLRDEPREARLAFWSTGWAIYVLWNLATVLGAVGASTVADPRDLGLDAAAPAAFAALLAPRLRDRSTRLPTAAAAVVALALTPLVPIGVPILVSAALVAVVGLRSSAAEVSS